MIGLSTLEVYISIFNITEENTKFEIYNFPDEKINILSYEKVRDDIEKDLGFSDFTATDLQDELIGPIIINEYREQIYQKKRKMNNIGELRRSILGLYFMVLKAISEQILIWLKMRLNWF